MAFFFDSYAVIELFKNNPNYIKYANEKIIINTLNLTEIHYSLLLESDHKTADQIIKNTNFEFIDITPEISLEASKFRHENKKLKLSYADCIGYVTSLKLGIKFLTGDKQFDIFPNVEFVK